MKTLKEIAARIWAIWGLLSFVITFLIVFLPSMITYLIPDPKGTDIFIRIARVWMNLWLWLVGCPIKITGRDHFKKGHNYIIVFNHNSFLDIPLSCPYVPGANKTIAKKSFAGIPLFGCIILKGLYSLTAKVSPAAAKVLKK